MRDTQCSQCKENLTFDGLAEGSYVVELADGWVVMLAMLSWIPSAN